jgi:diguanylate cyclase (GGDEF)-like protein
MALQQATLDAIEAGVVYYDAFGAVADANASASRLLRGRLELIADKRFADGTHLDEQGASVDFGRTFLRPTLIDRIPRLNFVVGIRLTENEVVWVTMYVRPVQHERYAAIASFTDVTLFKRDAERQRQIAEHDPLTGLANTKSWRRRVENAIELAKTTERNFGVVYVDLDGFKEVNDTLGHAFGDEALLVAASRMRGAMKSDDVLARLGGDEFAALVFYENGDEFVAARAGIASAFQSPIVVRDRTLDLRASIGMAAFPADGASVDALLEVSDSRMYANKARNRKR